MLTNLLNAPNTPAINAAALNLILFVPILAAIFLLLFINDEQKDEARWLAIVASFICLALSVYLFAEMNQPVNLSEAAKRASQGLSYFIAETNIPWVSALGISYHIGIDGVTAPMVLLTGLAAFAGVLISWRIEDRTREFFAFFLLLVAGVYGVFFLLDFVIVFFWGELLDFSIFLFVLSCGWA